jgi:hypothetical protein
VIGLRRDFVRMKAFYAFALEAPEPRTIFELDCPDEEEVREITLEDQLEFEGVIADALMVFPEAYRAVVEAICRWRDKLRSP